MNIGSFEVMMGVNTAGLSRAAVNMRRFESQVLGSNSRMQASFQALGSQMMLTGTMLTQFLTVPMSLLGGASVVAFAKFEAVLGKMVALTDFSSTQVKKMGDELLGLAGKVGKAPKELAEGLYFIGSSGIKDTAMAMDILKLSANAARIGLGETKTVADTLTSVINAYGKENITAARASDVLVAAVREGKGEADQLGRVIGKVMPLAVQLGVSFEEVAGSLATLTLSGKSAAEASTQMGRLFTTLVQQPPRAEAALEKMGISFAHLRKVLRDDGMLAFVQELKNMIGGNTLNVIQSTKAYEDNITVIGDVFTNIRALLPVLDMMGPNFENLKRVLDATRDSNGSLAYSIKAVTNTVADKWKRATSSMTASLIQLGEVIKDPLIKIFEQLTSFINRLITSFTNLPAAQKEAILSFITLAAVAGPALIILGQLTGAIMGFGRALFSLSLLGWITKLLVLASAIYLIYKNWDLLTSIVEKFEMKGAIKEMERTQRNLEVFTSKWSNYLNVLKETGKITGDAAKTVDTLIQKETELAALQSKMDSIPTDDFDAREDMYTKIATKLNQIYELRQKLTQVSGDSRNDKAMVSVLDDMLAMEKKLASYSVDIKMFDDAKNEAINFKDIWNGVLASIGEGVVSLQKKLLGIDFSSGGGGYGIDVNARDFMSPLKQRPAYTQELMPMPPSMKQMIAELDYATSGVDRLRKVFDMMFESTNEELQVNAENAKRLGAGFNKAAVDADILQESLDFLTQPDMTKIMTPEQIDLVQQMIKKFNELNESVNKSSQLLSAWKGVFSSLGSLANTVAKYMGESFQELFSIFQEGVQIVSGVLRVIEAMTRVTKLTAAAEKAKNVVTAAGIPITLAAAGAETAKAAASTNAAVAGAASSVAWIPIVGIGLAIAGIAAILMALSSSKKPKATGMATGGMVPSGFPNDSFPAMLTSGETVIPLTKLKDLKGNGQDLNITIEGVAKGTDIHYIVKEIERKLRNSN